MSPYKEQGVYFSHFSIFIYLSLTVFLSGFRGHPPSHPEILHHITNYHNQKNRKEKSGRKIITAGHNDKLKLEK